MPTSQQDDWDCSKGSLDVDSREAGDVIGATRSPGIEPDVLYDRREQGTEFVDGRSLVDPDVAPVDEDAHSR